MESDHSNIEIKKTVVDYINSKIGIWKLLPESEEYFSEFSKKYTIEQILHGIDISAKKYLKIRNNVVDESSVSTFLNKITGIVILEENPIDQKVNYIKGIWRNRFDDSDRYWNDEHASYILKKLVTTLIKHTNNEKQVLEFLDEKIIPVTKQSYCWSQWRDCMNFFIEELKT